MCLGCAYPAGLGVFASFCWCALVFCLLVPWMLLGFARFLRGCCFPGAPSPEVSPGGAALGVAAREGVVPRRHLAGGLPREGGPERGCPGGAAPPAEGPPPGSLRAQRRLSRGASPGGRRPRGRSPAALYPRGSALPPPAPPPRAPRSPSGAGHTGGTHGRVAPPVVDYCSGSASASCFRGLAWISAAPCFCPVCPPRFALWFCALARLRFVRLFARRPAA